MSITIETSGMRNLTVNGTDREIDIAEWPQNVLDFIIDYGTRQILNDCHASALDNVYPHAKSAEDIKKLTRAEKAEYLAAKREWGKANPDTVNEEREKLIAIKLERLAAGELRVAGSGKAGLTPLETMCYTVAREWLKATMDAKGIDKKSFTGLDKDEQYDVLDGFIANNEGKVEAEAQKRLDAKAAVASASIDISALIPKKSAE